MKKVVPFKKELFFKDNIAEITSISLEHTLKPVSDNLVSGEFLIDGDYRITDISVNTEKFNFKVPFDISIDDKYLTNNITIDIDDFYYEVKNSSTLLVNVDVAIDNLEVKEELANQEDRFSFDDVKDKVEEIKDKIGDYKTNVIDLFKETSKEVPLEVKVHNLPINNETSIFEKINDEVIDDTPKGYVTYRVYIMTEEDTIDSVLQKYRIERELLEQYNNLADIKIGDKLLIPTNE